MKPADLLDVVIGQQKTMELTFDDNMRAESYMCQMRRYKSRYPNMFSAWRNGNQVMVSPGTVILSRVAKADPIVRPVDGSEVTITKPLNHAQARLRRQVLEDFYAGTISVEDAATYLVENGVEDNIEDANKTLKESRHAAYK